MTMAHSVEVNITSHPLSREENGVTFVVEEGTAKYGELLVSKGGVRWKPKGKQDHHFIGWRDLDEIMRERPKK
jgi:hypothetical protein